MTRQENTEGPVTTGIRTVFPVVMDPEWIRAVADDDLSGGMEASPCRDLVTGSLL